MVAGHPSGFARADQTPRGLQAHRKEDLQPLTDRLEVQKQEGNIGN
jgi:hypothetical protein